MSSNNPEISILLATLRPERARKCIDSIAETSEGVNYEVVAVSPLDMPNLLAGCKGYDRIRFVREERKEGCNKAFSTAYANALGKYVFALSDDAILAQDCLKRLLEFMRPHDQEIFLAGARFHDAYGPGPECNTYGFYYPFNPCLRRDLVEQIGGFYDIRYRSYYGDPDLAMRVWHNGGKAELCPDAWVEFCNEYDDIDQESRTNYADIDFITFRQRWHPIYGHLVNGDKEPDINVANNYVLPGLPPAKCTRLLNLLARQDWPDLKKELESKDKTYINKDNLSHVFKELTANFTRIPVDIRNKLATWLISQLSTEKLPEVERSRDSNWASADSSSIILACIAMYVLSGGLKRYPETVVENYKGINIMFSPRKFYAWPYSPGGFSMVTFRETSDKFAFGESSINQVISKIDELMGEAPLVDWQLVQDMEGKLASTNLASIRKDNINASWLQKLPNEICLQIVIYLKLQDWAVIEDLLNRPKEAAFMLRNHLCYVYGEVLRNAGILPMKLLLELSRWLLAQLDASDARLLVTGEILK